MRSSKAGQPQTQIDHEIQGVLGEAEASEIWFEGPQGMITNPREVEGIDHSVVKAHKRRQKER